MKTGYRIVLKVSSYSEETEMLVIYNKMLAYNIFDFAASEKLEPHLFTFVYEPDEND